MRYLRCEQVRTPYDVTWTEGDDSLYDYVALQSRAARVALQQIARPFFREAGEPSSRKKPGPKPHTRNPNPAEYYDSTWGRVVVDEWISGAAVDTVSDLPGPHASKEAFEVSHAAFGPLQTGPRGTAYFALLDVVGRQVFEGKALLLRGASGLTHPKSSQPVS